MKFQNESIIKRNFDAFMEKQGSRLAENTKTNIDQQFADDFNIARLKLATAATGNRNSSSLLNP